MTRPTNLSGQTEEFEDFLLLNPQGRQRLLAKYADHAVEESLPIKWQAIPYNRVALMNLLAGKIGPDCRYLEIGCDQNVLFSSLPIRDKVGVDPVAGGNTRMTSDAFFAGNSRTFDLIFIDGLHTYEQVHRDVENALKVVAPGGYIGLHDMIPTHWTQEHVPRLAGAWTGDVWKVGVELSRSPGLDFGIFRVDHGVGLIKAPGGDAPRPTIADLSAELTPARFGEFLKYYPDLPVLDWDNGQAWINDEGEAT